MQYKAGARVYMEDGKEIGRLERVVIDPRTMQVSDIVVKHGLVNPQYKVIPATMVHDGSEDAIHLVEIPGGWDELPDFEETDYRLMDGKDMTMTDGARETDAPIMYAFPSEIPVSGGAYPPGAILHTTPAANTPDDAGNYVKETRRNIRQGDIALKEGARVISHDGAELGTIERLFTKPETGQVTHFVISRGMLLKEHKLAPFNWVDDIHEDEVHLGVNARFVEQLPDYKE